MRAIELFAGAGGLGFGVSKAGFRPSMVVEWNRWCCETIRDNRGVGAPLSKWPEPIEGDIRNVDFRHLEGKVELVSGGPPCQPFSLGGRHRANNDSRDMWPEAVRTVREVHPKAFVFENVKGLLRNSFANYFNYVLLQLQYPSVLKRETESWEQHWTKLQRHHTSRPEGTEEYRVVFGLLNAADYGVPQKRERVVFVGFRNDLNTAWSFPRPTHSLDALLWSQCKTHEYWERHQISKRRRVLEVKSYVRGMALDGKPTTKPWRTTRDAIFDLPDPELHPRASKLALNHKFQPGAKMYPGHTGSLLDEPAKTLKAGVHGVPGGENMVVREDGSVRYFTVRESARLQCFPDTFNFHGAWSEAMRQLGNAVPVDLAAVVASSVAGQIRRARQVADSRNGR